MRTLMSYIMFYISTVGVPGYGKCTCWALIDGVKQSPRQWWCQLPLPRLLRILSNPWHCSLPCSTFQIFKANFCTVHGSLSHQDTLAWKIKFYVRLTTKELVEVIVISLHSGKCGSKLHSQFSYHMSTRVECYSSTYSLGPKYQPGSVQPWGVVGAHTSLSERCRRPFWALGTCLPIQGSLLWRNLTLHVKACIC